MRKTPNKRPAINDVVPLSELTRNQKGKVVSLDTDNRALRRRFLDMGITEGVQVIVKKLAPLGDPVDIELRGYELCIRKRDLAFVTVEVMT